MGVREIILVVLFAAFFVGTVVRVLAMRERKKAGGDVDRARLVFFFLGCLMLICLIPMELFDLLTAPVIGADLAVVAANFVGYALTYDLGRKRRGDGGQGGDAPQTKRVYQIYYRGRPFGLITKEGIDLLLAHKLLMRQHTVELVEDFQSQAQKKGLGIKLLRSKDNSQTLVKVEGPPGPAPAASTAPGDAAAGGRPV